jgi:2-dehydropantoate 2-reductase
MRILVYGAGSIGGYLGAILADAGEDVTLVARGATYEAMTTRGVILEGPKSGRPQPIKVKAVRPGEEKGPYDVVFVTLKSHQLAEAAVHVRALGHADTAFVFPQNGLPWWYFDGIQSKYAGTKLRTLDPDGVLGRTFDTRNIIGGIAFKPTDSPGPAHIKLSDPPSDALAMGEVDNRMSERVQTIGDICTRAGWKGAPTDDIRKVKWTKLMSNAVWNTLGVITQATPTESAKFAPTAALATAMMREVIALASAVGTTLDADAARMVEEAARRPSVPNSTLQDVRVGRSLELDALINVLLEMGEITGTPTPNLSVVAACAGMVNHKIIHDKVAVRQVKL